MWWIIGLLVMFAGGMVAGGMVVFTRRGPVLAHSSISVHNTHTTHLTHHVDRHVTERVIVPVLPGSKTVTVVGMLGTPAASPQRRSLQLESTQRAQAVARVVPGWTRQGPHAPGEDGR